MRAQSFCPSLPSPDGQLSPSQSSSISVSVWGNGAAQTSARSSLSWPRAIPPSTRCETHQLGEPRGLVEATRLHRCRKLRPKRVRPAFPSLQALFRTPPPSFLSPPPGASEGWRGSHPGEEACIWGFESWCLSFQASRLHCPAPPPCFPPTLCSHLCSRQGEGERGEGRPQCPGWPRSPPHPPGLCRGPGLSPTVLPHPACGVPPGSAPGASTGPGCLSRGQQGSQENPGRRQQRCWVVGPQGPGPCGGIHSI